MRLLPLLVLVVVSYVSVGECTVSHILTLGSDHTCLIVDSQPLCFGYNTYGELGNGLTVNNSNPLIPGVQHGQQLATATTWFNEPGANYPVRQITAGYHSTCVIYENNPLTSIRCCGVHGNRRVMSGLLEVMTEVELSCTNQNLTLATARPYVYAPPDLTQYDVIQVANGYFTSCELRSNGGIRCWGSGNNGILGYALPESPNVCVNPIGCSPFVPMKMIGGPHFGDLEISLFSADEVSSVPQLVFGPGFNATDIFTSYQHACALFLLGFVRCWGNNFPSGGMKAGGTIGETAFVGKRVLPNIDIATETIVSFSPAQPAVVAMALGFEHTCFIFAGGTLGCVGGNTYGQLGIGSVGGKCTSTIAAPNTCMTTIPGLYASVTAGNGHTCAITVTGVVTCWGRNSVGQLGIGSTTDTGTPTALPFSDPEIAVAVTSGQFHNCAIFGPVGGTLPRRIRCWGSGVSYRLGTSTTANIGTAPGQIATLAPLAYSGNINWWNIFPRIVFCNTTYAGTTAIHFRGPELLITAINKVRFQSAITPANFIDVVIPGGNPAFFETPRHLKVPSPDWRAYMGFGGPDYLRVLVSANGGTSWEDTQHKITVVAQVSTPVLVGPITFPKEGNSTVTFNFTDASRFRGLSRPICRYFAPSGTYDLGAQISYNDTIICTHNKPETILGQFPVAISLGDGFPFIGPYTLECIDTSVTGINPVIGYLTGQYNLNITSTPMVPSNDPTEIVIYVVVLDRLFRFATPATRCSTNNCIYMYVPNLREYPQIKPYIPLIWAFLPAKFFVFGSFNGQGLSPTPVVHWLFDDPVLNFVQPSAIHVASTETVTVVGANLLDVHYDITANHNNCNSVAKFGCAFWPPSNAIRPRVRLQRAGAPTFIIFCSVLVGSKLSCPMQSINPAFSGQWSMDFGFTADRFLGGPLSFYYFRVTSIWPRTGPTTGGTQVEITGNGFIAETGSQCRGAASIPGQPTVATLISFTKMICFSTPLGTSTPVAPYSPFSMRVSNLNSWSTPATELTYFEYYVQPQITAAIPVFAPIKVATRVTLFSPTFQNITIVPTAPVLMIDTLKTTGTLISVNELRFVSPSLDIAAGTLKLSLAMNGIDFALLTQTISLFSVMAVVPQYGPTTGGTLIAVTGIGYSSFASFSSLIKCRFGTEVVSAETKVGSLAIRCSSPPNAPGLYVAEVSADGGDQFSIDPVMFTYYSAPSVSAIFPDSGEVGTVVTVYGSNLNNFAGAVISCRYAESLVVVPTVLSLPTSMVCPVPLTAPSGALTIGVSFNDGANYSPNTNNVFFYSFGIVGLTPSLGPDTGGSVVLVAGTGFINRPAGMIICRFASLLSNADPYLKSSQSSCRSPATTPGMVSFALSQDGGITFSTSTITYRFYQAPTVTALYPQGGPAGGGAPVTVYGSNFADYGYGVMCRFGAAPSPMSNITTSSQVVCVSPSSIGGSVNVEVSLNAGYDFTANGLLYGFFVITSVIPSSGPTTGGSRLSFSGHGFIPGAPFALCMIGVTTAPGTVATTQLASCLAPPSAPVSNTNVDFSLDGVSYSGLPLKFTYYLAPKVTALVPNSGPGPGKEISVTIWGSDFNVANAVVQCRFATKIKDPILNMVAVSYVVCLTPIDGTGIQSVEMTFNGGFDFTSDGLSFSYYSLTSFEPKQAPLASGTTVFISGNGFSPSMKAFCLFGGSTSTPATYISPAQVKCPSSNETTAAGPVSLEFYVEGSATTENGLQFTYFQPPNVVRLQPRGGPSIGGMPVTVIGTGFQDLSCVCKFGQLSVPAIAVPNGAGEFDLVCFSPSGSGRVPVEISLNAGFDYTNSKIEYFYFAMISLFPSLGPLNSTATLPATVVTLNGGGFLSELFPSTSKPVCKFGTLLAPLTLVSNIRITCTAPATFFTGGVDFQIYVPPAVVNNTAVGELPSGSVGLTYTYYVQPNITGMSPVSGPSSGGTVVTIWGTGLFSVPSTTIVNFGLGNPLPATFKNASMLTFVTLAATLPVDISISFNGYQTVPVAGFNPFTLISVFPPLGPAEGGTVMEFRGTGFTDTGTLLYCRFGSFLVPAKFQNPSLLTCTTPSSTGKGGTAAPTTTAPGATPAPAAANTTTTPTPTPAPAPANTTTSNGTTSGNTTRLALGAQGEIVAPPSATTNGYEFVGGPTIQFVYYPAPVVSSVVPIEGPSAGNTTVVITGSGLNPTGAIPTCIFGNSNDPDVVPIPAFSVSDSQIMCMTPAHTATTVPVLVSLNRQNYYDTKVAYVYKECPAGFFSPTFRDSCQPCPRGFASAIKGAQRCQICDSSSYAPAQALTSCSPCPKNSYITSLSRENKTQCSCFPEYFEPNGLMGQECFPCPVGAVCEGGIEQPYPLKGYWRSDGAPLNYSALTVGDYLFVQCDIESACPGGKLIGNNTGCGVGYFGRLCSVCQDKYFKRRGECFKCPPAASMTLIGAGIFVVLVCVLLMRMVGPDVSAYGGTINITVYFLQVIGILGKLDLKWPVALATTMTYANVVNVDIDLLGPECSAPSVSFQQKWLVKMFFPILLLVIFIIIFLMTLIASTLRKEEGQLHHKGTSKVALLGDILINVYLLVLALIYLFLVSSTFQLFDCTVRADGIFTLDAQPSLICYDAWWYKLLPIGVAGIVVYALTIPAVFIFILRRFAKRLDEPRVIGRYGATFIDYRPERSYWEAISMLEKLGIGTTLTFFTKFIDVQMIAFLLVTVMGLATHIIAQPFFITRYNRLQTLLRWSSCLMIMAGMIFRAGNFPGIFVQVVVTGAVFVIIGMSVILVSGIIVYDVLMIQRSLGSKFDDEVSGYMLKMTTPQGKTELMEFLGTGVDPKLMKTFGRVIRSIGRYYARYLDFSNCPVFDPKDFEERVVDEFADTETEEDENGENNNGDPKALEAGPAGSGLVVPASNSYYRPPGQERRGAVVGAETEDEDDGGGEAAPATGAPGLARRQGMAIAPPPAMGLPGSPGAAAVAATSSGAGLGNATGAPVRRGGISTAATPSAGATPAAAGEDGYYGTDEEEDERKFVFNGAHGTWVVPPDMMPIEFIGYKVMWAYTKGAFVAPVNAALRRWAIGMITEASVDESTPKSITARKAIYDFITVFTEVLRFSFYANLGIKNQYRQSNLALRIPWLKALRKEGDSDLELDAEAANERAKRKAPRTDWFWERVKDMPNEDRLTTQIRDLRERREAEARVREQNRMNMKKRRGSGDAGSGEGDAASGGDNASVAAGVGATGLQSPKLHAGAATATDSDESS